VRPGPVPAAGRHGRRRPALAGAAIPARCHPVPGRGAGTGSDPVATARIGYLFGPALYRTADGGQTWHRVPGPPTEALQTAPGTAVRVAYHGTGCPGPRTRIVQEAAAGTTRWRTLLRITPPMDESQAVSSQVIWQGRLVIYDPEMRVPHETICLSLFVQARGALRKELLSCLRTGRARSRPQGLTVMNGQGKIRGMVNISERPAEAADRAVPGHWEGDIVFGVGYRTIATLVERASRFVMLVALPDGHGAEAVADALSDAITTLPGQLRRSLTWDQGKEMADHARFSITTGVPVYFCDPHSPWQRGSNENTNGLLRQYFPRRTDFKSVTQSDLDNVAAELNDRPRQTLNWKSPCQALDEALR